MKKAELRTRFDKFFNNRCDIICSQRKTYSVSEQKRSDKMTPIGIIRKVDNLGRIVIPKEIRKFYHINANDEIEIVTTPDGIILRKPEYEVRKIKSED